MKPPRSQDEVKVLKSRIQVFLKRVGAIGCRQEGRQDEMDKKRTWSRKKKKCDKSKVPDTVMYKSQEGTKTFECTCTQK